MDMASSSSRSDFLSRLYLLIWLSAARLAGAAQIIRLTERSDRERVGFLSF